MKKGDQWGNVRPLDTRISYARAFSGDNPHHFNGIDKISYFWPLFKFYASLVAIVAAIVAYEVLTH